MEQKDVRFYKLDKSKRYGAEGTYFKVADTVISVTVLILFWAVTVALAAFNFDKLFRDVKITVFICLFIVVLSVITALLCAMCFPVIKKRSRARKIIKDCTLTDGTVIDLQKQKLQHYGSHRTYSFYRVLIIYSFHGPDGALRYGKYTGSYGEIPFFVGQNLMIAFNETDSVIISKFTLSDGAEEFAKAEAERERADFTGLTGDLIKVDTTKPVNIAKYSQSLFKTRKRKKRFKVILQGYPRFTAGRMFIKKSTYRHNAKNNMFYCFVEENGRKRVEECAGLCNFKDGAEVTVVYGGGASEIISDFTLKKKFVKPRRNKSD